MKKISTVYLLIWMMSSGCSKKDDPGPSAEFSFTADGIAYSFPGDYYARKGSIFIRDYWFGFGMGSQPNKKYILQGTDTYPTRLLIDVITSDLQVGTYSVSMRASLNNTYSDSSANCILVISKLENGRASGNFSGEVFENGRKPVKAVVIANGKFTNVVVSP